MLTDKIVNELQAERKRQISKGFADEIDDNRKDLDDWCEDIIAYAIWAKQMARMGSPDKYRNRMKQIATIAAAACDSYDRTAPMGRWFGREADVEASAPAPELMDYDALWSRAKEYAELEFARTHVIGQYPDREKIVDNLARIEFCRLIGK